MTTPTIQERAERAAERILNEGCRHRISIAAVIAEELKQAEKQVEALTKEADAIGHSFYEVNMENVNLYKQVEALRACREAWIKHEGELEADARAREVGAIE